MAGPKEVLAIDGPLGTRFFTAAFVDSQRTRVRVGLHVPAGVRLAIESDTLRVTTSDGSPIRAASLGGLQLSATGRYVAGSRTGWLAVPHGHARLDSLAPRSFAGAIGGDHGQGYFAWMEVVLDTVPDRIRLEWPALRANDRPVALAPVTFTRRPGGRHVTPLSC